MTERAREILKYERKKVVESLGGPTRVKDFIWGHAQGSASALLLLSEIDAAEFSAFLAEVRNYDR